jgi:hypothetical protein
MLIGKIKEITMSAKLKIISLMAIVAFMLPVLAVAGSVTLEKAKFEFHVGVSPEDRRDDFGAITGWDPLFGYYGNSDVRMDNMASAKEKPAKAPMAELDVGVSPEDRRDDFGAIIGWDPLFGYYGDSHEKVDRILTCETSPKHLDSRSEIQS